MNVHKTVEKSDTENLKLIVQGFVGYAFAQTRIVFLCHVHVMAGRASVQDYEISRQQSPAKCQKMCKRFCEFKTVHLRSPMT